MALLILSNLAFSQDIESVNPSQWNVHFIATGSETSHTFLETAIPFYLTRMNLFSWPKYGLSRWRHLEIPEFYIIVEKADVLATELPEITNDPLLSHDINQILLWRIILDTVLDQIVEMFYLHFALILKLFHSTEAHHAYNYLLKLCQLYYLEIAQT